MTKRILIIRAGAVGDFVMTLPVFAALQTRYPGAVIDVLGAPSIAALAVDGRYAGEILSIDRADLAPLFVEGGAPSTGLAGLLSRYDLIVSYLPDPGGVLTANLARISPARLLTGSSKPSGASRTHVSRTHVSRTHTSHRLFRALAPLGIQGGAPPPRLRPSEAATRKADAFLASRRTNGDARPVIAVHPGSGGRRKCWPAENYAAVLDALAEDGVLPLITAGPADEAVLRRVTGELRRARPVVASCLGLPAVAALLARCRYMIGNDTGVTHLAAAVGTPTLALFGPTDPAVYGPRGEGVAICWGKGTWTGDAGELDWPAAPASFPAVEDIDVERVLTMAASVTAAG